MSEKAPQSYILHAVAIALVLTTLMILFLHKKWG